MQADDEYEYRVIGWRHFEREKVQEQIDALIADGWKVDGELCQGWRAYRLEQSAITPEKASRR